MIQQDQWWTQAPPVNPQQAAPQPRQPAANDEWWASSPPVQQQDTPRQQAPRQPARQAPAQAPADPLAGYAETLRAEGIPESEIPDLSQAMRDEANGIFPAAPPVGSGQNADTIYVADELSPEQLFALGAGDRLRLPSGEVVTLRSQPVGDTNIRPTDRQVGRYNLREPNLQDQVAALSSAYTEQIPFGDDAIAGAVGLLSGEGYSAVRQNQLAAREVLNQTEGGLRDIGGIAGFGVGAALTPGGAFISRAPTVANAMARGLAVGLPVGAVYGAGAAEGGITERAIGAGQGAAAGAVFGGATPVATAAATGVGQFLGRSGARAVDALLGREQTAEAANRGAVQALRNAMQTDGVDQNVIRNAIDQWEATGVIPNLVDIVPRAGATQRLLRGAAVRAGPAATRAEGYLDQTSGGLQDRAINMTRGLTPETRTADEVVEALREGRSAQAQADYAGPYRAQVPVDDNVLSALADEPGRAALRRARSAAVSARDYAQVAEIDALMGANPPATAAASVLDRARIAMGERGRNLTTGPTQSRDVARGLFGRAADLDRSLDAVEAIRPARETYRRFSEGMEGVDVGQRVLREAPDRLASQMDASPAVQYTAPVGAARAIENTIGGLGEGSTGLFNRIATAPNLRRNLESVFGETDATRYRQGIANLADQLNNARFLASSTGSQSAGRLSDALVEPVQAPPRDPWSLLTVALEKLNRNVTLTPQEADVLMRYGTSQAALAPPGLFGGAYRRNIAGALAPVTAAQSGTVAARF